ncbi:MAG: lysophospholipid acyltransferase family protein [Syntrophales bacterium]|nr:lysophospholipid acyltransferase family protein [Syntrophales bacterium]MDD5232737.1 lysophospholipid acyltransferase family protein [Syntrophales bacterium]
MVDLKHLNRIRLVADPFFQQVIATCLLKTNYRLAGVDIELENSEKIPKKETVIFAMNHTDRYNYWPFQYKLWAMKSFPYTTVWVKGKYYRNAALGRVLDWCNLIPVPSLGYLIEELFKKKFKRRIDSFEYRAIKDLIEGKGVGDMTAKLGSEVLAAKEQFATYIHDTYDSVMKKVAELSRIALCETGLNLIIFPEGTRSLKLGEGKTGLAQLALHTGKKIVPVGCNNSDQVYRWTLPFAGKGKIVYRIGDPISVNDDLREFRIPEKFSLFSKESQQKYREQFEAVTQVVMDRISRMLDERYTDQSEIPAENSKHQIPNPK